MAHNLADTGRARVQPCFDCGQLTARVINGENVVDYPDEFVPMCRRCSVDRRIAAVMAGKNILDVHYDRGFACGVAVACGILISSDGHNTDVVEILRSTGLDTRAKMKRRGVNSYDLDLLRPVFAEISVTKHRRSPASREG